MRRLRPCALVIALVAGAAACGSGTAAAPTAPTATGADTVAGTTATTSTSSLPATTTTIVPEPTAYVADPREIDGRLKEAAARFVETLGTYGPGGSGADMAKIRLADSGSDPKLAEAVPELYEADVATLQIIYPQMGGLGGGAASVIVLAEQHRVLSGVKQERTMALDLRLEQVDGNWKVTGIEPDRARLPSGESAPSPLAEAALVSPQLILTDTAREDLSAGLVDDRLLELLLDLADRYTLSVVAFVGGHPHDVFGKPWISNHTRGRGVDIWAVDGELVLGAPDDGPARAVAQEALDLGSTEIGSPWDLDGPGGPSLTDDLHADHLHLAFDGVG